MNAGASMVFFSTVAAQMGMPFHASIAAAKGAVEGFVRPIAAKNAPKIRVNAIAQSLKDTPLAGRLLNNDKKKEMMDASINALPAHICVCAAAVSDWSPEKHSNKKIKKNGKATPQISLKETSDILKTILVRLYKPFYQKNLF